MRKINWIQYVTGNDSDGYVATCPACDYKTSLQKGGKYPRSRATALLKNHFIGRHKDQHPNRVNHQQQPTEEPKEPMIPLSSLPNFCENCGERIREKIIARFAIKQREQTTTNQNG